MFEVTNAMALSESNYPEWLRTTINNRANVGWLYSGDPVIGWSWSPSLNISISYSVSDDCIFPATKRRIIPSEPFFYIDLITSILGDLSHTVVNFEGAAEDGITITCSYMDGDSLEFISYSAADRLLCFMGLLLEVAELYWYTLCPSISDLNSKDLVDSQIFFGFVKSDEIDIITDFEDKYAVLFHSHSACMAFLNKYSRFEQPDALKLGVDVSTEPNIDMFYNGTIQMTESVARIYSLGGDYDDNSLRALYQNICLKKDNTISSSLVVDSDDIQSIMEKLGIG